MASETSGNQHVTESTNENTSNTCIEEPSTILPSREDANIVLLHVQKLGQLSNNSSILVLNEQDFVEHDKINPELKLQAGLKTLINSTATSVTIECSPNKISVHKEKSLTGEKVYVCDFEGCGRAFHNFGYIKYHQAVHYGEKTLQCHFEGCGRKFTWPAHLKYHLLTHTGDRTHKCTLEGCGRCFYTLQRLAVHMRTHTGERPFICLEEGCNKGFTTAGNLKNHMRLHSGTRPFICIVDGCGRRFTEHSSLRKHTLVHTGEKPHLCDICGKSFSQSGSRNQHKKQHHKSSSKNLENYKESSSQTETVDMSPSPGQLVVFQQCEEEEMLQVQDFSNGSEPLVFSNAISTDHVMTIATHGDIDHENMDSIVGAEEVLGCVETVVTDSLITHSNANVVVLAQPQDMVSMATNYHHVQQHVQEEVVYESDLIITDIKQEETSDLESQVRQSENSSNPIITTMESGDKNIISLFNMSSDDKNEGNVNKHNGILFFYWDIPMANK